MMVPSGIFDINKAACIVILRRSQLNQKRGYKLYVTDKMFTEIIKENNNDCPKKYKKPASKSILWRTVKTQ